MENFEPNSTIKYFVIVVSSQSASSKHLSEHFLFVNLIHKILG